jgi:putative copper resistance protein D
VAVIGVLFVLNVQVLRVGFAEDLRNPFPPIADSMAIGEPIYASTCATCHGAGGRGDGPAGAGLPKPPADMFVHVPLHSDTILFEFIRDGITQSGMPGQAESLSEDEIWHLVNYVRAAFDER